MNTFSVLFLLALAIATGTRLWLARRHVSYIRGHRDAVPADFAPQITRGLRDAVGAGAMPGPRQPRDAAEGLHGARDAFIVSGHDDGVNATGLGRTAIHVLDHGPAHDVGEDFSWETRRIVSGGNDGDDVLL